MRTTPMASNFRQQEIVSLARQLGRVTVEELAARFDVTPQTIRKDLNDLCDQRVLTRTHGGAILSSGVENVAYEARRNIAQVEKQRDRPPAPRRSSPTIRRSSSISARPPRRWRAHLDPPRGPAGHHQQHPRRAHPHAVARHRGDRRRRHGAPQPTAASSARRPSISSASSRSIMPSSASRPSTRTGRCSTSTIARFAPRRRSSRMPARSSSSPMP